MRQDQDLGKSTLSVPSRLRGNKVLELPKLLLHPRNHLRRSRLLLLLSSSISVVGEDGYVLADLLALNYLQGKVADCPANTARGTLRASALPELESGDNRSGRRGD